MYGELCTYAPSHIVISVAEQGKVIRVFARCGQEEITLGEISQQKDKFVFTPTAECQIHFAETDARMVAV